LEEAATSLCCRTDESQAGWLQLLAWMY
jgi:hypothetical protein